MVSSYVSIKLLPKKTNKTQRETHTHRDNNPNCFKLMNKSPTSGLASIDGPDQGSERGDHPDTSVGEVTRAPFWVQELPITAPPHISPPSGKTRADCQKPKWPQSLWTSRAGASLPRDAGLFSTQNEIGEKA